MIKLKAEIITEKIRVLYLELRIHQGRCKHKRVIKVPRSSTGNWCKSDDYYWYQCKCPTCLKVWQEDQ